MTQLAAYLGLQGLPEPPIRQDLLQYRKQGGLILMQLTVRL